MCKLKVGKLVSYSPALLSAIAAIFSAIAAWQANKIAQSQQDSLRDRTVFSYEIRDKKSWTINIFQVSGEPYHIRLITLRPRFTEESGNLVFGNSFPITLLPESGRNRPFYIIKNIKREICTSQTCDGKEIDAITIEYKIYGEKRIMRLP